MGDPTTAWRPDVCVCVWPVGLPPGVASRGEPVTDLLRDYYGSAGQRTALPAHMRD